MEYELYIILVLSLFFSAIFSGSEIAFLVANRLKIEVRARKKITGARTALQFIKKPETFFSTMLVGNNIANVACSSVATALFGYLFGWDEFTILIAVSISILLFGEILPKSIARDVADYVIIIASVFIRGARIVLYPIVRISEYASHLILRSFHIQSTDISNLISRSDIDSAVRESRTSGTVDLENGTMIVKAMYLAEQDVSEVMIPRTEIIAVDQSATIQEVIRVFRRSGFSRLPVYKDTIDQIMGVIYAHDLFQRPRSLKSIIREVLFVPETKKSVELLKEFRKKGITIAIVVDEYGGTAGLITTEDLIEELVGEIHDEYDVEDIVCDKIDEKTYLLNGRVEIDHLIETFGLDIPDGDYETIAGYVLSITGSFPKPSDFILTENYRITIESASPTKIHLIKVEVMDEKRQEQPPVPPS
jgi:putative hemolysin